MVFPPLQYAILSYYKRKKMLNLGLIFSQYIQDILHAIIALQYISKKLVLTSRQEKNVE